MLPEYKHNNNLIIVLSVRHDLIDLNCIWSSADGSDIEYPMKLCYMTKSLKMRSVFSNKDFVDLKKYLCFVFPSF